MIDYLKKNREKKYIKKEKKEINFNFNPIFPSLGRALL